MSLRAKCVNVSTRCLLKHRERRGGGGGEEGTTFRGHGGGVGEHGDLDKERK